MKTDFALMNGGGIREALKKGPITWGDLYNIQPFRNVLTKLKIKGKDLRRLSMRKSRRFLVLTIASAGLHIRGTKKPEKLSI